MGGEATGELGEFAGLTMPGVGVGAMIRSTVCRFVFLPGAVCLPIPLFRIALLLLSIALCWWW